MKKDSITFTIEGAHPPSVNDALNRARNGRMYPSKTYTSWREAVKEQVKKSKIKKSEFYESSVETYFPLYFKNGNLRIKDSSNYLKYADDELCNYIETYEGDEIDDKQIIHGEHTKINCKEGEEKTVWTIWTAE